MGHDIAAKWILEHKRPDLIANWFKQRQAESKRIRELVETKTWGGLGEDQVLPSQRLQEIKDNQARVAYLLELCLHAASAGAAKWENDQDEFRFVTIAVQESQKFMKEDLLQVSECHDLVANLIRASESRVSNM